MARIAQAPPTSCAADVAGHGRGARSRRTLLENMRPTLIAGLAKLAELVKK